MHWKGENQEDGGKRMWRHVKELTCQSRDDKQKEKGASCYGLPLSHVLGGWGHHSSSASTRGRIKTALFVFETVQKADNGAFDKQTRVFTFLTGHCLKCSFLGDVFFSRKVNSGRPF
jgi:hypothetical protein